MQKKPRILIVHDGEYVDPLKMVLIEKFPRLAAQSDEVARESITTTDIAFLYTTVISDRQNYDIIVATSAVSFDEFNAVIEALEKRPIAIKVETIIADKKPSHILTVQELSDWKPQGK